MSAIDDGVAAVVIAQLLHLQSENPEADINLYLNSPGGSLTALMAIEIQAREVLRLRAQTEEVLARHTGRSVEQLRTDTDRDLILTAPQAVAYGIVDDVVGTLKRA